MKQTKEHIKNKKKNAKIFPIYKMLSWDLLFYYAISFLFLYQVKHISSAQILLGEMTFTLSCVIFQIPAGRIVDRIGKKNSLIIANLCITLYVALLLVITNFAELILIYILWAIGYVIKGLCETNILYDSLPSGRKRGNLFSTIDGKATSYYFYIDAVTSLLAGFLYVINPYLPIYCCLAVCIFSSIVALMFSHTRIKIDGLKVSVSLKVYLKNLKSIAKHVRKSKRILCLVTFFAIFSSIFYTMISLRSSLFTELNIPEQYFGIIFAILQIISGYCSSKQHLLENKFKNRTLTVIGLPVVFSMILIGFIAMTGNNTFSIATIIILFMVQHALRGTYYSTINKYINNFTNRNVRAKITTIKNLAYNLMTVVITLISSLLLSITDTAKTFVILGCMLTIATILLLDFMRDRVGLKPEEYTKEDVKYDEHKIKS
jgi:MFS family permease